MNSNHITQVHSLLKKYQEKYNYHQIYSIDELKYMLLNDFMYSYVVVNNNIVVDFICCSQITYKKNLVEKYINCVQLHLYTAVNNSPYMLISNMIKCAINNGFDLLTIYDQFENNSFIDQLKFVEGNITKHVYIYNYRCIDLDASQIGKTF